jgi:hypothetical protein
MDYILNRPYQATKAYLSGLAAESPQGGDALPVAPEEPYIPQDTGPDFLPFTMPASSAPPSTGSPYTIDPTGGGQPQMDPSTIAAGYGRKTAQLQRPNIYAPPGGYQAGLVPGGF